MNIDDIVVTDSKDVQIKFKTVFKAKPIDWFVFWVILNKSFQTIFCGCDRYFRNLDLAYSLMNKDLPMNIRHYKVKFNKEAVERLYTHFLVTKIPTVIILDSKGVVITQHARSDIEYKGLYCYEDWLRMSSNY